MVENINRSTGAQPSNSFRPGLPGVAPPHGAGQAAPAAGAPARAGDLAQLSGPPPGSSGQSLQAGRSDADFVKGLYRSILGREADPGGLAHHIKLLGQGMSRDEMAAAIRGSQERRNRDAEPDATFVRNLHRELLNQEPSDADVREGLAKLAAGMTRDDLIRSTLNRPDYMPSDTNEGRLKPGGPAAGPGHQAAPGAKPAPNGQAAAGEQRVRDGGGGFLWKPVSDSTGKLAVLLPPAYAGNTVGCKLVGPDGAVLATGKDGGVGNGDRQHYRFDKPGAKYPAGTKVVVDLADGSTATWTVQNTGARND